MKTLLIATLALGSSLAATLPAHAAEPRFRHAYAPAAVANFECAYALVFIPGENANAETYNEAARAVVVRADMAAATPKSPGHPHGVDFNSKKVELAVLGDIHAALVKGASLVERKTFAKAIADGRLCDNEGGLARAKKQAAWFGKDVHALEHLKDGPDQHQ